MKIRVMEIRGVGCCKGGKAPHRLYPRNARFFATAPAAGHGIADRGPRMSGWRRLGQAGNKRLAGAVLAVRRDRRREAAGDAGVRVFLEPQPRRGFNQGNVKGLTTVVATL